MSYLKMHFSIQFTMLLYIAFSAFYKSLNPLHWSYADSFIYWSIVMSISGPLFVSAYASKANLDLNTKIDAVFELTEFKNKKMKMLDCILNHYTNVATVGLFIMLIIYILRPFVKNLSSLGAGLTIAFLFTSVFLIYSLFLLRLGAYLSNYSKKISLPILFSITFIDLQAIEIFIRSTPKA
jgi:hypothetical protein